MAGTGTADRAEVTRRVALAAWVFLGHACVALGVLGAFLPVLPTTVFLIAAAACYARGNPALERRLLAHPTFGPALRDWREHRAMSLRAKLLAIAMVVVGIGASVLFAVQATWLRVGLSATAVAIVVFLVSVKTRRS